MMQPGHTHEDIDAMFRFVADSLRAKGLVRTIDEFVECVQAAFKEQVVHVEQVATVHDYTAWLKPNVGEFDKIKTARYFAIALRESDHFPILLYKPYAAHQHLYPALKDPETRMPLFDMVDGQKRYQTDMEGIEIFAQLPSGTPGLQAFEGDRLSLEEALTTVEEIMRAYPSLFDLACAAWWKSWFKDTECTAEEAVVKHPMSFEWPEKSGNVEPLTLAGLESGYKESITYLNSRGRQAFSLREATQAAREQAQDSPELNPGDLLVLRPGEDDGMHRLPFWIAEVNEVVPSEQSEISITWRTAFKGGYAKDDLSGQWLHICVGSSLSRGGRPRYHAFTPKCQAARGRSRHGQMHGIVDRDQVALYFAKLTDGQQHM